MRPIKSSMSSMLSNSSPAIGRRVKGAEYRQWVGLRGGGGGDYGPREGWAFC